MKFAEEIFPKGSFKKQQTDGAMIDDDLAANLNIYAKKIKEDMHFLLLITGNDSVGNGKTTLMSQVGSYLTWKINKLHKTNNTFTHRNLVFKGKELQERSLELPPLSVVSLDEGDDLTEHQMKKTAMRLKKYFRKCRQLNQILILILPSFFELPRFYSMARSHCLINVKFMGSFERGYFDYYGPSKKKELYMKGKKEWNYNAAPKDFEGRFFGSYCFFPNTKQETELYLKAKYEDMLADDEDDEFEIPTRILNGLRRKFVGEALYKILKRIKKINQKEIAGALEITEETVISLLKPYRQQIPKEYNESNPKK